MDGDTSESLLQVADNALYEMKNGRQLHLFVSQAEDNQAPADDKTGAQPEP